MWNQPYFNQPPMGANPFGGGYIYVPVQAPTSQVPGMPTPSLPRIKRKSMRKQLKEAEETKRAVEEYIERLKKAGDGKKDDKPKDDKKDDKFNIFRQSVLLLLTVPFLTLCEIYAYKQMVKPG